MPLTKFLKADLLPSDWIIPFFVIALAKELKLRAYPKI
jgi:hypothetical protein